MISSTHKRLFEPGGCLTPEAIRSFIDGSLGMTDRLRVEEHLRKCNLCTEALQGYYRHSQKSFLHSDLEFLSKRIKRTYARNPEIPGRQMPVLILFSLTTLLLILLGIFYIIRQDETNRQLQSPKTSDSTQNEMQSEPDTIQILPVEITGDEKEKSR
jgi:hypothetical protein